MPALGSGLWALGLGPGFGRVGKVIRATTSVLLRTTFPRRVPTIKGLQVSSNPSEATERAAAALRGRVLGLGFFGRRTINQLQWWEKTLSPLSFLSSSSSTEIWSTLFLSDFVVDFQAQEWRPKQARPRAREFHSMLQLRQMLPQGRKKKRNRKSNFFRFGISSVLLSLLLN